MGFFRRGKTIAGSRNWARVLAEILFGRLHRGLDLKLLHEQRKRAGKDEMANRKIIVHFVGETGL